ncbi:hypothetical protein A2634_00695 [Candidatus Amesbacteria bacterium RIFCSPHIGHO2_01_FULL_48_32]|uniref:Large ribosomal subunit protein uL15 n=1 Tax=Candidatus Amesbacteria bacterium RIFCSPLOWO2_01_FULL_48_25 TaxID=1797259 RepID=A0A1F4ZAV2_9BACT|nr:MAG: hypothetical protein A2634_00695 [Candidatus Amesbacteria bacterium RIFCSPHIGHO2_01_FULL_48_32]OGD03325.1 MAG: hypothetical protein A2989_00645 [Candidatus Amesbacteria bacterium RIFCSPLOWO2_01_FULL_48_25]HJZ05274.1 uL15m family ribosomal protein [Patescibacteria group bacterium]
MNLSDLPKIVARSKKRVGRGIGSGKGGHTAGRGTKGQKAREKIGLTFEGTKVKKSFVKKTPLLRGKGKFRPALGGPVIIKLKDLADWPVKTEVTVENLIKRGLVKYGPVKILGDGEIKTALVVKVATSKQAAEKITKAGGKMVEP